MTSTAPSPPAAPAPRTRRRPVLVGLCFLLLAGLAWIVARGTWASPEERNPRTSDEGIQTQLYLAPDGSKQVRCAAVLDQPPEKVWSIITGYDRYPEVFPTVRSLRETPEPDGRRHLVFELDAAFSRWTVDVRVTHQVSPEKRAVLWDEPTGAITKNRGSWTLTPAGPGKTLLVYLLDVGVRACPDFLVRNVLLSRQPSIVESVIKSLARGA